MLTHLDVENRAASSLQRRLMFCSLLSKAVAHLAAPGGFRRRTPPVLRTALSGGADRHRPPEAGSEEGDPALKALKLFMRCIHLSLYDA